MDWIAYLNALELRDSASGLKLKVSQIAELNKQFGADPNFAMVHDKDHGTTGANLILFFPIMLMALREQSAQIKALTSGRDAADSTLAINDVKLAGLLEIINLNRDHTDTQVGAITSAVERETESRESKVAGVQGRLTSIENTLAGLSTDFSDQLENDRSKHQQTANFMNMFKSVFEDEPYVTVQMPPSTDMITAVMTDAPPSQ